MKRSTGGDLYIVPYSAVKDVKAAKDGKENRMVATTMSNVVSKNPYLWTIRLVNSKKIVFSGEPFK